MCSRNGGMGPGWPDIPLAFEDGDASFRHSLFAKQKVLEAAGAGARAETSPPPAKPCISVQNRASPVLSLSKGFPPLAGGDAGWCNARLIPPPIVRICCHDRARRNRESLKKPRKTMRKNLRGREIVVTPFARLAPNRARRPPKPPRPLPAGPDVPRSVVCSGRNVVSRSGRSFGLKLRLPRYAGVSRSSGLVTAMAGRFMTWV